MLIEPPLVVTFKVIDQNVMKIQKLLFIGLDTKCLPNDPFAFTPNFADAGIVSLDSCFNFDAVCRLIYRSFG